MPHEPLEPTIAGNQAPPPYRCTDVKLFAFPLPASAASLQDVCDRFINITPDASISFRPKLPHSGAPVVTLEVLDYASLQVTTSPWSEIGEIPQLEFLFRFEVIKTQKGHSDEEGIFISHIFVDEQGSAFTGREVIGLPKMLASFKFDSDNFPNVSKEIELSLQEPVSRKLFPIVKVKAPTGHIEPLLKKTPILRFRGPLEWYKDDPNYREMQRAFERGGPTVGYSSRILIDPTSRRPDSYRSIMRSVYDPTSGFGELYPDVTVTLFALGFLDIRKMLGIQTDGAGRVTCQPYSITIDFSLGDVITLWESCIRS